MVKSAQPQPPDHPPPACLPALQPAHAHAHQQDIYAAMLSSMDVSMREEYRDESRAHQASSSRHVKGPGRQQLQHASFLQVRITGVFSVVREGVPCQPCCSAAAAANMIAVH